MYHIVFLRFCIVFFRIRTILQFHHSLKEMSETPIILFHILYGKTHFNKSYMFQFYFRKWNFYFPIYILDKYFFLIYSEKKIYIYVGDVSDIYKRFKIYIMLCKRIFSARFIDLQISTNLLSTYREYSIERTSEYVLK